MAFALSKNVLLIVIFVLFMTLMLNLFFGCRSFYEGFEAKEMTEEAIETIKKIKPEEAAKMFQEMLKKGVPKTESKKTEEAFEEDEDVKDDQEEEETSSTTDEKASKLVKDILDQEVPKEKRPLTKKEMELFEAISKDQVSNEDLEKLVKAGIVTESLVERFLNQMQEDVPTKTEDVVEGFSCERDFTTF